MSVLNGGGTRSVTPVLVPTFHSFTQAKHSGRKFASPALVASPLGTGDNFLFGCYSAGKHALEGLSKTLRKECEMHGIKVVVIAPGNIATSIWEKQTHT